MDDWEAVTSVVHDLVQDMDGLEPERAELVGRARGLGLPPNVIAALLGDDPDTIRLRYGDMTSR
jgi:hypothetical protein